LVLLAGFPVQVLVLVALPLPGLPVRLVLF